MNKNIQNQVVVSKRKSGLNAILVLKSIKQTQKQCYSTFEVQCFFGINIFEGIRMPSGVDSPQTALFHSCPHWQVPWEVSAAFVSLPTTENIEPPELIKCD